MTASTPRLLRIKAETLLRLHLRKATPATKRELLRRIRTLDACVALLEAEDDKGALKLLRTIVPVR